MIEPERIRPPMSLEQMARETLDRTRRIETRQASHLESIGFNTKTQRPVWYEDGSVVIPSMDCSIKDILAAVPPDHHDRLENDDTDVIVYHKSTYVMTFYLNKE